MTGNHFVGIMGVIVASFVWGSNFTVVRKYDMPADGVHFAFLMSIGIITVGLLTLVSSPMEDGDFEVVFAPCGILGGALWAVGNFLTVPIIQCLGLGVGLAIWAGTNMIVAFLVGAMGLEGIGIDLPREPLTHPFCGGFGVVLAVLALIIFANVKSTVESRASVVNHGEEAGVEELLLSAHSNTATIADGEIEARISPPLEISSQTRGSTMEPEANSGGHYVTTVRVEDENGRAPLGVLMAVLAGTLYGIQFAPLKKWNDKVINNGRIFGHDLPSDTTRALRFFFSQFAGIFMTATAGFVLYCVINKNKPQLVPPEATLPSIICGATWAVGCSAAMLATSELGNTVGFPLVLNFSFLVNSAWSILVFQEIQGRRNLQLFGGAFFLNVMSSLFISISK